MEELNLEPPNTNPSRGSEEDLNSGPPDHKSSALYSPDLISFPHFFFHTNQDLFSFGEQFLCSHHISVLRLSCQDHFKKDLHQLHTLNNLLFLAL